MKKKKFDNTDDHDVGLFWGRNFNQDFDVAFGRNRFGADVAFLGTEHKSERPNRQKLNFSGKFCLYKAHLRQFSSDFEANFNSPASSF